MRRVESSSSEDSIHLHISKARSPTQQHHPHFPQQPPTPGFATSHANSSTTSLQNFSRPTPSPLSSATAAAVAARSVAGSYDSQQQQQQHRTASPMSMSSSRSAGHSRKHSQTAGVFEPTLPSISTSNLSTHVSMSSQQSPVQRDLTASQIAAQAAVLSHQQSHQQHQQQHQMQQQMLSHSRQRSQTAPLVPSDHHHQQQQENAPPPKRTSGPLNPPVLSLTEASAPRDTGFGSQGYHNGLLGSNAAATAANAAFPRSGQTSPVSQIPPQPPPPPPLPEKKPEKSSKMKLFSKPSKIGTKGDPKDKPLPSPSKIGSALSALQRGNFSTTSLDTTAQSFYNMNNASTATIRPGDGQPAEKEKRHHFLSRQRHKTKDKDDYHSQLSSAASNSRPTDPSAPTSLYNFKLPSSPGPNSSAFKNISGLGHGARARKKDDKVDVHDSVSSVNDWAGPGSLGSVNTPLYLEPIDSAKYGLNSMSMDDAFPYLKSKLLVIFEGEDLRLPVEDFNRVVTLHIQYCIKTRSPMQVLDDLRDLLWTGFSSLDHNLRKHSEDHLIPNLVDLWMHVFTGVLPYMQAVFLPLDLEFSGTGSLLSPDQARDFWGGVITSPLENPGSGGGAIGLAPASAALDVRRMVLTAYRDVLILPRYDRLKTIFSRLSLDFFPGMGLVSPLPEGASAAGSTANLSTSPGAESAHGFPFGAAVAGGSQQQRPGTAMSLDPSTASYNSTSTTLLGDLAMTASGGAAAAAAAADASGRSRGLSNVSFASSGAQSSGTDPASLSLRPPGKLGGGGTGGAGNVLGLSLMREQSNVEDSKYVTDMVGRMLQCMSVLAGSAGSSAISGGGSGSDEGTRMVKELGRLLKLNWLGRGRTGRNRRGIVGGRVARRVDGAGREEVVVG